MPVKISQTEENYLKAIFKLSEKSKGLVNTNSIATEMKTSAASVTDMLQRLHQKALINYKKWKGVNLTEEGRQIATNLIRKHRLWEVFLVQKLAFSWDEVHDIAEQLEHIKSPELVERLDNFLSNPKFDPHGDPIPDANGKFAFREQVTLASLAIGEEGIVVGVKEHSTPFLKYLDQLNLIIGTKVAILGKVEYDESVRIRLNDKVEQIISDKVSKHLFVSK